MTRFQGYVALLSVFLVFSLSFSYYVEIALIEKSGLNRAIVSKSDSIHPRTRLVKNAINPGWEASIDNEECDFGGNGACQ